MSDNKPQSTDNQSGYNTWSEFYDQYPNPTVAADDLAFFHYWDDLENKNILEIGPGTGRNTLKLLERHNHVVGIDISEGMLQKAKEKLPEDNLELIHADIMTYEGFKPNQFDAVIASLVIEHIHDLPTFFKKITACLKIDGQIFISEIHPDRTVQGILAHFKVSEDEEVHLTSHAHTEEDYQRAAAAAGLEVLLKETVYGSEELAQLNPKWQKHVANPLLQIWEFKKSRELQISNP